jgi:hypothetical protein
MIKNADTEARTSVLPRDPSLVLTLNSLCSFSRKSPDDHETSQHDQTAFLPPAPMICGALADIARVSIDFPFQRSIMITYLRGYGKVSIWEGTNSIYSNVL